MGPPDMACKNEQRPSSTACKTVCTQLTKAYEAETPCNGVVIVLLCTAQDQFVFFSSVAVASLCDYFRAIMDNQKDGHFSYGEIHLYFSSVIYPDE